VGGSGGVAPVAGVPAALRAVVGEALDRWRDPPRLVDATSATLADRLAAGQLDVAYQTVVALPAGRPVAVEALVRPTAGAPAGLQDAADIVTVAERSGLIVPLGLDVLGRACAQLRRWRGRSHLRDLQVHVNVSPLQLRDDRLVPDIERTLALAHLPATAIVLEITETAAFESDGIAETTLTRLAALGIELAIDDFGTGFASLELLAATPARSIKLDRTFVDSVGELGEPPRGRAVVVQAAIGLGRALGLRIVAEGIESGAQVRTLTEWGCEFGQGYLFGRPLPADQVVFSPIEPPAGSPAVVPERLDHLSPAAIDLAVAVSTVLAASDPASGSLRADAQELALLLAEATSLDRRGADVAGVLASIRDAPYRLPAAVAPSSPVPASAELAVAVRAAGTLAGEPTPAQLAAAAWRLATARRRGATVTEALASSDLGTADGTAPSGRLAEWWSSARPSPSPLTELGGIGRRLRSRDDSGRRLRSLSALTRAIGSPGSLTDVLEVTAEEARSTLGAASLSISRFEREHAHVRTLVNVGTLAPWEQRRPLDETYPLASYPLAMERLLDGAVHVEVAGDPAARDPAEAALLERLGKGSSAAVPIVVDGTTWGEVYATTELGSPPFTTADIPFLTAIASVVSLAISRAEHVDRLTRFADEDPLTRLANRRVLEHRLERMLADVDGPTVGLLMLDVDGLKDVNDEWGHAEGDALLVRVGDVLARAALTWPGASPARLGGDEFCIVVPGDRPVDPLLETVRKRLADGQPPQPRVSAGFASVRPGSCDVSELLRRADAAQYLAKRTQAPLVAVGPDSRVPEPEVVPASPTRRRNRRGRPAHGPASVPALRRWRTSIDATSTGERLEALGDAALSLLDLNRWTLSEVPAGADSIHIRSLHMRRRRPNARLSTLIADEVYRVEDYPTTAAALANDDGFSVHVDDPAADPRERALLVDNGLQYVVAVAQRDPDGSGWLLELFGDADSTALTEARPLVEALGSRSLGRRLRCSGPGDTA
jgi:diguanylate cyclase (GGDEF)-like protein